MHKRIRAIAMITVLSLSLQGCVSVLTGERGNGNIVSEERSIGAFNGIELSGGFDVELTHSGQKTLKITTDENLLDNIETYVRNDVLHVNSRDVGNATEMKLVIHYEDIEHITSSGAVEIRTRETLVADEFGFESSGASEAYLQLDVGTVYFDFSGASETEIIGKAEKLVFEDSGACELKAYELETGMAEIEISGAGEARVNVSQELSASVSGAGNVYYRGNPERIRENVSGAGGIHSD